MRGFFFLILLFGCFFTINAVKANDIIDTKGYFPLDVPHGYIETDGQTKWHTEFLGLKAVDDKSYYITTTAVSNQDGAERLADKSFYAMNNAGDIYRAGYCVSSWLIKWNSTPELILKRKMELGNEYVVQDDTIDGKHTVVKITLQKLINLKLVNRTVSCIVIEKHAHVENSNFENNFYYSYEYKYYASGIGMVKHEGTCYGCQCANLAPAGGKISLLYNLK